MIVAGVLACAVLGLVVGLLLNVVIDQVPARERLFPLRFRCPHLPRALREVESEKADAAPDGASDAAAADATKPVTPDRPALPARTWLHPVGPCPGCGARLPRRYLLVPLGNAALFAAAAVRFGADWVLPAYLLFFAVLLAVSVIDLQLQIIPNRIVYPAIFASVPLLALAAAVEHDPSALVRALISGALAWAALLLIYLLMPGGMGFGDVRLCFLLGLFLGWLSYGHVVLGLFFGFLLGAVIGLVLVGLRLRRRTDHVPFGPFLAAGAVLAVLFGAPLVRTWL